MARLTVKWTDTEVARFAQAFDKLGADGVRRIGVRVTNRVGEMAKTQVIRKLTPQTGLKRKTIVKAVVPKRASYAIQTYEMKARGGDVALKHFGPRETQRGTSAAPFGHRQVYPSAFTRAGWWPKRVIKANWKGQVFRRTGGVTSKGHDEFAKVKSGVVIPVEMVQGRTASAFLQTDRVNMPKRLEHELRRLTGGVVG